MALFFLLHLSIRRVTHHPALAKDSSGISNNAGHLGHHCAVPLINGPLPFSRASAYKIFKVSRLVGVHIYSNLE
jgi:hypothetical protein